VRKREGRKRGRLKREGSELCDRREQTRERDGLGGKLEIADGINKEKEE
jgi:hypothetical protein